MTKILKKKAEQPDLAAQKQKQNTQIIPLEAKNLVEKGKQLGIHGELDQARELFLHATLVTPNWVEPYFDLGIIYLYKREFEKALVCFKKVDQLEPRGFKTGKAALHTLQQELKGSLPEGTYLKFLVVDLESDPDRRKQILQNLLACSPGFAPAWTEMVNLSLNKNEQMHYITRGLTCEADEDTRGFLLIQKALILHNIGKLQAATDFLARVINHPDCTLRNEKQAKMILGSWLASSQNSG